MMGMLLMRRAGIKSYAPHVDEPGRSLKNTSLQQCDNSRAKPSRVLQATVRDELTERQAKILLLFPLLPERQWQPEIRKVGDGKRMGVGERGRREAVTPGGYISSQQFLWGSPHRSSVSISRWKINNLFRRPLSPRRVRESFPRSSVQFQCSYRSVFPL